MKYSCYNSIISLTEKSSLMYNSLTDSFIVFNSKFEKHILHDFDNLKEHNYELYQMMIKARCFIDDEIDEFIQLKKINDDIINDDTRYFIIVNPTLACNFKCWYCYESHIRGSKMSKQIYDRVVILFNEIVNSNKNLKSFTLAFFGGEPLLYFKSIVLPLIKTFTELCVQNNLNHGISFTSNGSLLNQDIVSELLKYGQNSFQITLDGGEEYHNKVRFFSESKGSYRTIINNILLLLSVGIDVRLRINYTRDNLFSIKEIVNDICDISQSMKNKLEIDFHRVWQDKDGFQELEGIREVLNAFINQGFKLIYNALDEIRDSCYGDKKNSLVVNYNGDVFKCTAKDFTSDNRDGFLDTKGNIKWINSQEYRRGLKLKSEMCHYCRIAPLCGGGVYKISTRERKKR